MEELPRVGPQLLERRAFETPIEGAEEVAAVAPVQRQQRRALAHEVGDEARPPRGRKVAAGQPGVGVDDVGRHERVLQVEHGEMPFGRQNGAPLPIRTLVHHRATGLGTHAGVLEHRGQVDLVDITVPVDRRRVEFEPLVVRGVADVAQLHEVVHPVASVRFGVGPVQHDIAESTCDHAVPVFDPGGQLRLLAPDRQGSEQLLHERHGRIGALELALHPSPAREGPLWHVDGLATVVVQRIAAERSPLTIRPGGRSATGSARPTRRDTPWADPVRAPCCHRQDGRHHQVDRDDVDDAFGHARELAEQAPRVGNDDGLGHPEATYPAGAGFRQRGLDDRRPHERNGDPALPLLDQRLLAESLGEGVGVGPTERERPRRARPHELVADPLLAEFLRFGCDQVVPGGTDLRPRLFGELAQLFRRAGLRLQVVAEPPGRGHLVLPADDRG